MIQPFRVLPLAARNFQRNLPRYRTLIVSLVLAVLVLTLVVAITQGTIITLRAKASRYFGGEISLQVFARRGVPTFVPEEQFSTILDNLPRQVRSVNRRSVYHGEEAVLYFAGQSIRQRRLIGVNWEEERSLLSDIDLRSGALPVAGDEDGTLISSATAEQLGAQVGDELLIRLETEAGQLNTGTVQVRGIFEEASFFGFVTYLNRERLNQFINVPESYITDIGFSTLDAGAQRELAEELVRRAASVEGMQVFPVITSREQRSELLGPRRSESWIAIITLDAQLSEITDLIDAMSLSAAAILAIFVGLIVIGVGNSFRMLVHERKGEIGTLRAMGMQQGAVRFLFSWEAFILGAIAATVGLLGGLGVLQVVHSTVQISGTGWSELFFQRGRISWNLGFLELGAIVLLSVFAGILGSYQPARSAAAMSPVEALRDGE